MDFRDEIRILKAEYLSALKRYYNESNMIFKIVFERKIYSALSDGELYFRTAHLKKLSDKSINKVYEKNQNIDAITALRTRAVVCIYIADIIRDFSAETENKGTVSNNLDNLFIVHDKLITLARESIQKANDWAQERDYQQFDIETKLYFDNTREIEANL